MAIEHNKQSSSLKKTKVIQQLFGCPTLLNRESVSSWMIRTAVSQGIRLGRLYELVTGLTKFTTNGKYDLDLLFSNQDLQHLGRLTGKGSSFFQHAFRFRHFHSYTYSPTKEKYVIPIRMGYAYCPECLKEPVPYLREDWRLQAITICHRHQTYLKLVCDMCHNELKVTRYRLGWIRHRASPLRFCPECKCDLSRHISENVSDDIMQHLPTTDTQVDEHIWVRYMKL